MVSIVVFLSSDNVVDRATGDPDPALGTVCAYFLDGGVARDGLNGP